MNKKRMWLLAISVATMVTATGFVMAATTADKQDNSTGKLQQTQSEKGNFPKRCGMKGFHEDKQALLEFLKVDAQTFEANIKDGKTLATIAKEQGISEQELTDFMVKQLSVHIDKGVKEGRLSDAKATQMRADIAQRAADMIHGKAPMHGFGPMGHSPFHNEKLLSLLNIDKETLKTERASGKSLLTIAKEHDVSEQELTAFMTQQMTERIDEDVKAGRIQENQAVQMKANMEKHITDIINGRAPMHGHGAMHNPFHNEKLLSLLNMDEETLKTEMKSGKSLLKIAEERGVSEQSLKDLMLEDMAQHIDQDVKEGRIPADKAEQIKAAMANRVSDMINGKVPMKDHPRNDQQ
ncbi:LysM peptidoglycan-binding domain-containing protein [Sporomusa sp. KB1]|jgi:AraC-like DNA-binding protein|uniref:LysM peptidoglycan-binding domain-containing protein n=1 Tax=Sporomusa sp. KB1 TaxID=943346 RepID=UPI0011AAF954|nr:LysM peptidoglycan-binding domain-containing protein [Sporomusa sp. KB1]TWH48704.1 LysM domain-containing protein [Sporomusa sp. KB1]